MPKKIQLMRNSTMLSSFDDAKALLLAIDASTLSEGELVTCSYSDLDGSVGVLHALVINGSLVIVNDVDDEPLTTSSKPVKSSALAEIVTAIAENYATTEMLNTGLSGKLSTSGTAESASKLANSRTIGISTGATGTATAFDGSANIKIPVTSLKEAYLELGGKNLANSYSALDMALLPEYGANRFAFLNVDGITTEYSTDGGSNWTDYTTTSSITSDTVKQLVGKLNQNLTTFRAGGPSANWSAISSDNQIRITIEADAAGVCSELKKFVIPMTGFTTTTTWKCNIEGRLYDSLDTFTTIVSAAPIAGYPGVSIINLDTAINFGVVTNGSTTGRYLYLRFTFYKTTTTTNHNIAIQGILAYGGTGNKVPSNMATNGRLYSYDNDLNVTFPGTVTASSFVGTATNATSDAEGNNIVETYAKKSDITSSGTFVASDYYNKSDIDTKFNGLAEVANSGSYTDLSDLPTLATVATSGSYNDLNNKPDIPGVLNYLAEEDLLNHLYLQDDNFDEIDAFSEKTIIRLVNNVVESLDNKVNQVSGKGLSTNDYTTDEKNKLANISSYTIGEGLTVENGVLKCNFTPTRYYTGSSTPTDDTGNNGDLYLLIN